MQHENFSLLDQQLPEKGNIHSVTTIGSFLFGALICLFSLFWSYWFYEHLLRTRLAIAGGEIQWMKDIVGLLLRLIPMPFFLSCWGTLLKEILYKEIILYSGSMIVTVRIRVMSDLHYPMNYAFIHVHRSHFWGHAYAKLYGAVDAKSTFVPISRLIYLFRGIEEQAYAGTGAKVITVDHNDNKMSYQLDSPNSLKWTYGTGGWIGLLIWVLSSFAFVGAVIYLIRLLFVVEEVAFFEYVLLVGFIVVSGFGTYLLLSSLRLKERFEALRSIQHILIQPQSITISYRNKEEWKLNFDEFKGVKNVSNSGVKLEYIVNGESDFEYLP